MPQSSEMEKAETRANPALRESIRKTLAFFALFDFPLSPQEVLENLYHYPKPVHIKEIKGVLGQMEEDGEVEQLKGFSLLQGRAASIELRKARSFIAERLWHRAKFYANHMRMIPFVRMAAVCNSLAYDNATEESDIDLLVVVKPGRLWLARLLLTVTLQLFGVRRHGSRVAGRFCLSFFVTEQALSMESLALDGEDPYLLYWTRSLSPLFGKDSYESYQQANRAWLSRHGMGFSKNALRHMGHGKEEGLFKKSLELLLGGHLGNAAEALVQLLFKGRTLRKASGLDAKANVIVSQERLKFHNHDRRDEYRKRWMELWKSGQAKQAMSEQSKAPQPA